VVALHCTELTCQLVSVSLSVTVCLPVCLSIYHICVYYYYYIINIHISWFLRSGEVRESQGKSRRSREVSEFKSTMVQKLTKMQKKNRTVARTLHTAVQNFFCSLRSQIICTFTFSFVLPPLFLVLLQVIESQHWYFA